MTATNRCYLVSKDAAGQVSTAVTETALPDLGEGDVLIRVEFSSLNYKDALAARGHPGVVRKFPHVPGIDAAKFKEIAETAKKNCPVSKVLAGAAISLDATLV